MTRIASRKYLDGARGESCKLRFDGCLDERETVVSCHLSSMFGGMGIKASDILVIDGCWRCHSALDTHTHGLTDARLYRTLLRALAETLHARHAKGLMVVPLDTPKPFNERPTKPRKPVEQRKAIQQRGFPRDSKLKRKITGEVVEREPR